MIDPNSNAGRAARRREGAVREAELAKTARTPEARAIHAENARMLTRSAAQLECNLKA